MKEITKEKMKKNNKRKKNIKKNQLYIAVYKIWTNGQTDEDESRTDALSMP